VDRKMLQGKVKKNFLIMIMLQQCNCRVRLHALVLFFLNIFEHVTVIAVEFTHGCTNTEKLLKQ